MNIQKWNSLTPEQQGIISKAALESQSKALTDWDKQEQEAIQKAKDAGSTFVYPDKAPYQAKVARLIEERQRAYHASSLGPKTLSDS